MVDAISSLLLIRILGCVCFHGTWNLQQSHLITITAVEMLSMLCIWGYAPARHNGYFGETRITFKEKN
jgi:hypothetical protein